MTVSPTNCRCLWELAADRVSWARTRHTVGCPVHGADNTPPAWYSPSTALYRITAADRTGLTVDELIAFAAGLIESGVDKTATLRSGLRIIKSLETTR